MIKDYKGIDKGEADTYAQLRKVNAHLIISDDKSFIKAILKLDKTTKIYTTLHLLCWLQLSYLIPDWKSTPSATVTPNSIPTLNSNVPVLSRLTLLLN